MESTLLRKNNEHTEQECDNLMKALRMQWLEPVVTDLQDRDNTDFDVLERRLRSAYEEIDSNFRKRAPGSKSLCYNLAYIYELVWRFPVLIIYFNVQ